MLSGYKYYINNIYEIFSQKCFEGWGRKRTGLFALWCYHKFGGHLSLYEDGFIRSMGLGVEGSPSFCVVEDDVGIYYDATVASKLENILNMYDFKSDKRLLSSASNAMNLIRQHHISKYNNASDVSSTYFNNDCKSKVLIIAQTSGDASLEYGLAKAVTTKEMIADASRENPNSSLYIKIHPDVLSGKKSSDITLSEIPKECIVLDEDVNPISLLKYFNKVYTKTSGMGMEALILGIEVHCYGMPYYSGWGLTKDKQKCIRRVRKLSVEELFAGAYMLYTKYYNPYTKQPADIFETIDEIIKQKKML